VKSRRSPGHPLRVRLLLEIARSQRTGAMTGDAKATLERVVTETEDDGILHECRNVLGNR